MPEAPPPSQDQSTDKAPVLAWTRPTFDSLRNDKDIVTSSPQEPPSPTKPTEAWGVVNGTSTISPQTAEEPAIDANSDGSQATLTEPTPSQQQILTSEVKPEITKSPEVLEEISTQDEKAGHGGHTKEENYSSSNSDTSVADEQTTDNVSQDTMNALQEAADKLSAEAAASQLTPTIPPVDQQIASLESTTPKAVSEEFTTPTAETTGIITPINREATADEVDNVIDAKDVINKLLENLDSIEKRRKEISTIEVDEIQKARDKATESRKALSNEHKQAQKLIDDISRFNQANTLATPDKIAA